MGTGGDSGGGGGGMCLGEVPGGEMDGYLCRSLLLPAPPPAVPTSVHGGEAAVMLENLESRMRRTSCKLRSVMLGAVLACVSIGWLLTRFPSPPLRCYYSVYTLFVNHSRSDRGL